MPCATAGDIILINFGMGSVNASSTCCPPLLPVRSPWANGALKEKNRIGDLILCGIRGEGTSNDYFPPEVPAPPSFALQRAISSTIRDDNRDYYRIGLYDQLKVWEHDDAFKAYLRSTRAQAIDMETATVFRRVCEPLIGGALLLVSDEPMTPSERRPMRDAKATAELCG